MKVEKLIELHKRKIELYEDITKLDLEIAQKKDEYRKISLEITKIEGHCKNPTIN